jgi:hypothetical protein
VILARFILRERGAHGNSFINRLIQRWFHLPPASRGNPATGIYL